MSPSRTASIQGSVMLLVMLMLILFVMIMAASVRFIARQSQQTVLQEQEEQAFEIADAGINYALWLLGEAGGGFTPQEIVANPPASATDHVVRTATGGTVGEFDLVFGPACSEWVQVRSFGYDQIKTELCQVIDAQINRFASGDLRITRWDHLVGYPCVSTYTPAPQPTCAPGPGGGGSAPIDLKVNGDDGPLLVNIPTDLTLSWTSTDMTTCTAKQDWSGSYPVTGTETFPNWPDGPSANGDDAYTFELECTGASGTQSDTVEVTTEVGI